MTNDESSSRFARLSRRGGPLRSFSFTRDGESESRLKAAGATGKYPEG